MCVRARQREEVEDLYEMRWMKRENVACVRESENSMRVVHPPLALWVLVRCGNPELPTTYYCT